MTAIHGMKRPNRAQRLARLSRTQLTHAFLWTIGGIIVLAAIASCAHMYVAFSWANHPLMGIVLSAIVVAYNVMFFTLIIARSDAPEDMVEAIKAGFFMLAFVEFFGNATASALYVSHRFPTEVATFFYLPERLMEIITAIVLGAFIPVLSYFAMLALVAGGGPLLQEREEKDAILQAASRLMQADGEDGFPLRPTAPKRS